MADLSKRRVPRHSERAAAFEKIDPSQWYLDAIGEHSGTGLKAIIAEGGHVRGVRAAEAGDFRAAREALRAAIRNGGAKRRVKSLGRLAQALIRSWR